MEKERELLKEIAVLQVEQRNIEARVSNLEKSVDKNNIQTAENTKQIRGIQEDVKELKEDVDSLQDKIDSITGTIIESNTHMISSIVEHKNEELKTEVETKKIWRDVLIALLGVGGLLPYIIELFNHL